MSKKRPSTDLAATSKNAISLQDKPQSPILPLPQTVTPTAPILPTDPPAVISDEERKGLELMKQQAGLLRDFSCGAALTKILEGNFGKTVGPAGYQYYRDQLMRDAGNPADPIERMLIEQLALAYHSIARMHVKAAAAQTPDEAEVYSGAAARLLGEFRRTALCYREFHAPLTSKKITLVAQQNLAAGDQQVAYINGDTPCQENSPYIEIAGIQEEHEYA